MKKLTKILTFISLGIIAASVMAVLLSYVYRVPLMELLFHRGQELPMTIPAAGAVSLVGQLGAMIWLCICVGDRRFGIWSELMAAGWLSVVLPAIVRVLSYVQTALLGRAMGTDYMLALTYTNNIWSYATAFNGIAVALALLVCGLSIADKHVAKNDRQL